MKSLRVYLFIAGVLIVIYIVAQLNRPKLVDWRETLNSNDKIPFGTYILKHQLKDIFPESELRTFKQAVYNVIAEDSVKNSTYLIVCPGFELTKADYNQLTAYLEKGNDVFIASEYFGELMKKKLKVSTNAGFARADALKVGFLNKHLDTARHYAVDKGAGNNYFSRFDTLKAVVLGENIDHQANFIKYPFGPGSLYLIANPKYFSNYSLLTPDGAAYSAIALSYLKNTKQIIWDEYYTSTDESETSPVRLFLSRPLLRWAYYITIFSLLIYVIYEIKRRQRIIPVIEPLANSTLEFVTVTGQVYYEKRDNANIAHKKILYFLTRLRDEHQLKTNNLDTGFIEKLTTKLGIDHNLANELVNYIQYLKVQTRVTDQELIELNKLIEKFNLQAQ